jgi:hypothetical protein
MTPKPSVRGTGSSSTLENLVALNKKRSFEETVGMVKWLRPEFQVPRFGSHAERARLDAQGVVANQELAPDSPADSGVSLAKPKFQTGNELAETADVIRVLAAARQALTVEQIARAFSQGKQIEKRVALTVLALARLGHLSSTDDGQSFMLRRAA